MSGRRTHGPLAVLAAVAAVATLAHGAAGPVPLADRLAGRVFEHRIAEGESLTLVSARYGIEVDRLAGDNGLAPDARLRTGGTLTIDSRHLVPRAEGRALVINIPQRRVFHFEEDRLLASYPVAVGRRATPTPVGEFTVRAKAEDPVWRVPASIQEEMRRAGKPVVTEMGPGPDNPLGRHWIGLSLEGIGLHGTPAPASIFQFASHGCIRLHADDVAELYERVDADDRGAFVYEPVLLGEVDGIVYLQVYEDGYRRQPDPLAAVRAAAHAAGLTERIDWPSVERAIAASPGPLHDVTRP